MACGLREDILVDERRNCRRAKGTSCGISFTSGRDQEELERIEKAKYHQIISLGLFCWREAVLKLSWVQTLDLGKVRQLNCIWYVWVKQKEK